MPEPAVEPCADLAERWHNLLHESPDVFKFLDGADGATPTQIVAVLRVDQHARWQRGERVFAEGYLQRLQALNEAPEAALDLIYSEVLLREDLGEIPDVEQYARRFPRWADALRRQWILHHAIDNDDFDAGEAAPGTRERPETPPLTTIQAGSADTVTMPWPQFSGYEILSELGRGGMGIVYKARQKSLNRLVALKTLASPGSMVSDADRFRREATAVARLQHPNIVQIFEIGEQHGQPFLALELVDGRSQAQFCAGAPQPPRAAAQFVETLARTIHFAHQHGIIHRDLKPANILLQKLTTQRSESEISPRPEISGNSTLEYRDEYLRPPNLRSASESELRLSDFTPKVTDFGLAKEVAGAGSLTLPGAILGTPSYMAPEQARGESSIGPAVDVYALGAILYELLTGRPPFRGATVVDTLQQVQAQEPVAVTRLQPATPCDLETICHKCLAKEPARRYGDAQSLAEDLERFLSDRPILARPAGPVERAWRWRRRNPLVADLTALIAFLVLATSIASIVAAVQLKERGDAALAAEGQAVVERNRAGAEARKARELLGAAYLSEARAQRAGGQAGRRYHSLQLLRQSLEIAQSGNLTSAERLTFRNEAVACLALADVAVERWHELPPGCQAFAFDLKLERYIVADKGGNLRLFRASDQRLLETQRPRSEAPDHMQWCPKDRYLAVRYHNDTLIVVDWETKKQCLQIEGQAHIRGPAFSPDGSMMAVALHTGEVRVWNLSRPASARTIATVADPQDLRFSPDGALLAVASFSANKVEVLDVDSGKRRLSLPQRGAVFDVAWHPSEQLLACASSDGSIQFCNAATGAILGTLLGHESAVTNVSFSHDGRLLASASWDGTGRLWDVASQRLLVSMPVNSLKPQFSSDDSRLAAAWDGRKLGIWQVAPGKELSSLYGPRPLATLAKVDHHPDGRWLSVASRDGVSFWDGRTGRHVHRLDLPGTRYGFFAPDGKSYFTTGAYGLYRWSFGTDPKGTAGQFVMGPAQVVHDSKGVELQRASISRDGRIIVAQRTGKNPLRIDLTPVLRPERDLGDAFENYISVSPDGQLAATGSWHHDGVHIVQTKNGALVRRLETAGRANVQFRPDSRVLATGTPTEFALWNVESGEKLHAFPRSTSDMPGEIAFSPDGQVLAVAHSRTQVQLINAETGEALVVLEPPVRHEVLSIAFDPDGTRLAVHYGVDLTHVWDLRLLREQLARLDLDWNARPYPPAESGTSSPPLSLRVEPGQLRMFKSNSIALPPLFRVPIKPGGTKEVTKQPDR